MRIYIFSLFTLWHSAVFASVPEGERLLHQDDPRGGIYVIISGLVKVCKVKNSVSLYQVDILNVM